MLALNLFFRIHRPYILKNDEHDPEFFGGEAEFREADRTEYQPLFALLERTTQKYDNFKVSLGISGIWLDQADRWAPDLIRRLKRLVNLGKVELLLTPYHYNLSIFYNKSEFDNEISAMKSRLYRTFGVEADILAMPELIYNDRIALWAKEHKLRGILIGNADIALDYRTSHEVYEPLDCPNLRLLATNSRFSEAIRLGNNLVMIEGEKAKEKFNNTIDPLAEPNRNPQRHHTSAAEFARAMSGSSSIRPTSHTTTTIAPRTGSGKMIFSARKFQKELELDFLRGDTINISLDTRIFAEFRSAEIVRFFDEFFLAWQKSPMHQITSLSNIFDESNSCHTLSIKSTIDWRTNHSNDDIGGLALLKDVCYCPPKWLSNARQIEIEHRLYALLGQVLATKDSSLYEDFEKFTALDYIIPLNPKAPILIHGELYPHESATYKRLTTILERFEKLVESRLPEPLKLAASTKKKAESQAQAKQQTASDAKKTTPDAKKASSDTEKVKVKIQPKPTANTKSKSANDSAANTKSAASAKPKPANDSAANTKLTNDSTASAQPQSAAGAADDAFLVKVHITPRHKAKPAANFGAKKSSAQPKSLDFVKPRRAEPNQSAQNRTKPGAKAQSQPSGATKTQDSSSHSHNKSADASRQAHEIQDAGDWDELIWDSENWIDAAADDGVLADYIDSLDEENPDAELEAAFRESELDNDFAADDSDVTNDNYTESTDDMDDAASEVQVLAQRLSRQQTEMTKHLDSLTEAEIIEP